MDCIISFVTRIHIITETAPLATRFPTRTGTDGFDELKKLKGYHNESASPE